MSNIGRFNARACKLLRAMELEEVGRWRLSLLVCMHNDSIMRNVIRKSGGKYT